jgi:hypothetical protein
MNDPILIRRTLCIPRCLSRIWLAGVLTLFVAGSATRAGLILDLPDLTLQPNQANQTFTISVQNTGAGVQLTGVQLLLLIGNGDVAIGGSGGGPAFQAVSLLAPGSLFAANNTGDRGAGNFAADYPPNGLTQLFQRTTSTSSGTVTLDTGTFDLATVTFNTTGIGPGDYSWAANWLSQVSFFTDTSQGGVVNPTLIGGMLTVVPEPVNVALPVFGGLVALAGGYRWWCRRKASAC